MYHPPDMSLTASAASASEAPSRPLTVAVVGATGLVGRTMIAVLEQRGFPVGTLKPLASRAEGRTLAFGGKEWPVEVATPEAFEGVDIALFSAGGSVSKELAPEAAKRGTVVFVQITLERQTDDRLARFEALGHSAGAFPVGRVHINPDYPLTLDLRCCP